MVNLGPYNLERESDEEGQACWVDPGRNCLYFLTRSMEDGIYKWSLHVELATIEFGWSGSAYVSDPQVAANEAWIVIETLASFYANPEEWIYE